ncbi:MAG: hypothetical protein ABSG46_14025 [Candidatus Binataceae bacterium]
MAKLFDYFFLTGFFVGFFFAAAMVLFSLGLDWAVLVPGFFVTAIRHPPLRTLLLDERLNRWMSSPLIVSGIIEMRYGGFKSLCLSL